MTRDTLIAHLKDLPRQIREAEVALFHAEVYLTARREALHDRESCLLFAGLDGRNEAIRNAKLRADTSEERELLLLAERDVAQRRMELRLVQGAFSAAKAIARLISRDSDRE